MPCKRKVAAKPNVYPEQIAILPPTLRYIRDFRDWTEKEIERCEADAASLRRVNVPGVQSSVVYGLPALICAEGCMRRADICRRDSYVDVWCSGSAVEEEGPSGPIR